LWLTLLSFWCVIVAITQRIPTEMALLGWVSYVFFVPLFYVGAELMADDKRAAKVLRLVAVAGGIVGLGAMASAFLGHSAPRLLQPIIPIVGFHSFNDGNVYLAPSIFATAEEAAEQLLVAFFAWIALAQLQFARLGSTSSAVLGMLVVGGMISTARRTDIIVAIVGVIVLAVLGGMHSSTTAEQFGSRLAAGTRRRLGVTFLLAAVGSITLVSFLGASKLVPFLTSGSPGSRLSLMFSRPNMGSLIGQGTGTSTQGANVVGAISFYGTNRQGIYSGYILNGRVFATTEGGFAKTWLELGIVGVILYGGVFLSVLGPAVRYLRLLDGTGRALTVVTIALGIIFLKGHQSLDDPLVQPLFWLSAGGIWGRMRALTARTQWDAGAAGLAAPASSYAPGVEPAG